MATNGLMRRPVYRDLLCMAGLSALALLQLRGVTKYLPIMRARDWIQSCLKGVRVRLNARDRSYKLLECNLTPAQRAQFHAHGYFTVIGGDTGRRYQIHENGSLNVHEVDQRGLRINRWCFLPRGALPLGDVLIAQKIALELFETDTLQVARRYPL